jgi:peptide/nickel transport system permease protein
MVLIRLGLGLLTLFLVSVVVFVATQALPGNAVNAVLGREAHDPAMYNSLRRQLGLDQPFYSQYGRWLGEVVRGDFGVSLVNGQPVATLIRTRVINSTILVAFAALLSIPLSILIGALSAVWRDRPVDVGVNLVNLCLAAMPEFVIGILLLLVFATGIFKVMPAVSPIMVGVSIFSQLRLFVLPAVTLALVVIPYVSRMLRASTIAVLESDYIMMARMKGLSGSVVLWRHAVPNALVPTIQAIAVSLAWLAGGIVTVEYVFGFPGIGAGLVAAVNDRDIPMIQALCLLIAVAYVILNLLADIFTILINPRLRTGLR